MIAPAERRRFPRRPVQARVKLRCGRTGHHLAARARDLSAGGCLLELDHPAGLCVGQAVAVAIPADAPALLAAAALQPATIVRTLRAQGRQLVALQFTQVAALANAA